MWYESKKDDAELEFCVLDETIPPCRECEKHFFHQRQTFTPLEAGVVVVSILTLVTDIVTDGLVTCQYFASGEYCWGLLTLSFMLLPSLCTQFFSLRWYQMDEDLSAGKWIAHCLQLGPLYRYFVVLQTGMIAKKSGDPLDFALLYHQQSDVCMLRLFESFLESAPQVVLQLYIMVATNEENFFTGISAMVSVGSLCWAIAVYSRIHRRVRDDKTVVSWPGVLLQAVWRIGMISSRVVALVLFATVFKAYVFLVIALHWAAMMVWVVLQNTDFCLTWIEERLFNAVIAVVYVFCFFNLKEGTSRYRVLVFYCVIFVENVLFLVLWHSAALQKGVYTGIGFSIVFGGFIIGVTSMVLYYRYLHPHSSVSCCSLRTTKHQPCLKHEDIIFSSKGMEAEITPRSPSPSPRPFHRIQQYTPLALPISAFTTPGADSRLLTPGSSRPASSSEVDLLGPIPTEVKGQQRARSESCLLQNEGSHIDSDALNTAKSLCGLTAGPNSRRLSEWVGHFADEQTSLTKDFFDKLTPDILNRQPPSNYPACIIPSSEVGVDLGKSLGATPRPVSRVDSVSKKLFQGSTDRKMHRSFRRQLHYQDAEHKAATPARTPIGGTTGMQSGPPARTRAATHGQFHRNLMSSIGGTPPAWDIHRDAAGHFLAAAPRHSPVTVPSLRQSITTAPGVPVTTTPRDSLMTAPRRAGSSHARPMEDQKKSKELLKLPTNNVRAKLEVFEALGMSNTSLSASGAKANDRGTPRKLSLDVNTPCSPDRSLSTDHEGYSGIDIGREQPSVCGGTALGNQDEVIITGSQLVAPGNQGANEQAADGEHAATRNGVGEFNNKAEVADRVQQLLGSDTEITDVPAHEIGSMEDEPLLSTATTSPLAAHGTEQPVAIITSDAAPQGGNCDLKTSAPMEGHEMVSVSKGGSSVISGETGISSSEQAESSNHSALKRHEPNVVHSPSECLGGSRETASHTTSALCVPSVVDGSGPMQAESTSNSSLPAAGVSEVITKMEMPAQLPLSEVGEGQMSPLGEVQCSSNSGPAIKMAGTVGSGKENQSIRSRKSFGNVKIRDIKENIANSPKKNLKKSRTSFSKIPTDIVAKRVSSLVSTPEQ